MSAKLFLRTMIYLSILDFLYISHRSLNYRLSINYLVIFDPSIIVPFNTMLYLFSSNSNDSIIVDINLLLITWFTIRIYYFSKFEEKNFQLYVFILIIIWSFNSLICTHLYTCVLSHGYLITSTRGFSGRWFTLLIPFRELARD